MVENERFPKTKAETLSGKELVLPDDVDGDVAFIGIAFVREAQSMLDSWTRVFEEMCSGDDVYELPIIESSFWKIFSGFIDGGMRSGIPKEKHDNVATHYGDASEIRGILGMDDKKCGYVFLIDEEGRILFKGKGYADEEGEEELLKKLRKVCSSDI